MKNNSINILSLVANISLSCKNIETIEKKTKYFLQ